MIRSGALPSAPRGALHCATFCWVCKSQSALFLVTASLVAVRGLARSLQNNYGIQPKNVMLVKTDLQMAGDAADQRVPMQKRMLDAAAAIPGVTAVGYSDRLPLSIGGGDSDVSTDTTALFPVLPTPQPMPRIFRSLRIISVLLARHFWRAVPSPCTMTIRPLSWLL